MWTPAHLLVAPQWANSSTPTSTWASSCFQPHNGENIEQVLRASQLGTDTGYRYLVHVTGYPDSANSPIACVQPDLAAERHPAAVRVRGYTGGTSGSPWVTRFNARSRTGTIVGVIGGYQEGGDTPSVSYSVRFGTGIQQLYEQAAADGSGTGLQ